MPLDDDLKKILLSFYVFLLISSTAYFGIKSVGVGYLFLSCFTLVSIYFGVRFARFGLIGALARSLVIAVSILIIMLPVSNPRLDNLSQTLLELAILIGLSLLLAAAGYLIGCVLKTKQLAGKIDSIPFVETLGVLVTFSFIYLLADYQFFTLAVIDRVPLPVYYAFADVHNYFGAPSYWEYNQVYLCNNKSVYVVSGGDKGSAGLDVYLDKNGSPLCKVSWYVEMRDGAYKAYADCPVTSDCEVLLGDASLRPFK